MVSEPAASPIDLLAAMLTVGGLSSSRMIKVLVLFCNSALSGLTKTNCTTSSFSSNVSPRVAKVTVFCVSPGAKTKVPEMSL